MEKTGAQNLSELVRMAILLEGAGQIAEGASG